MSIEHVYLVTCYDLPEADADRAPLEQALGAAGIGFEWVAWDDPEQTEALLENSDSLVLLRSPWNYAQHHDAFLNWLQKTADRHLLLNPLSLVSDNLDKNYLLRLKAEGCAIVPTTAVPKNNRVDLAHLDWGKSNRIVIKPSVGAGSFMTRNFERAEIKAAQSYLESCAQQRDMLIQPYLSSVEREGEKSLVWFGGRLSHAVIKSPRFVGHDESITTADHIADDERALAEQVLQTLPQRWLYARVDIMRNDDDEPCLNELELIEPSLFFTHQAGSAERFVDAMIDHVKAVRM